MIRPLKNISETRSLEIVWTPEDKLTLHPKGMHFKALASTGAVTASWEVYSVGGGALRDQGSLPIPQNVYDLTTMREILDYCEIHGLALWKYFEEREDSDVWQHLENVWA